MLVNNLFMKILHAEVANQHRCELQLPPDVLSALWSHLLTRFRSSGRSSPPVVRELCANLTHLLSSSPSALPRVQCYFTFVSDDRAIVVLVPSSFDDVLIILRE